MSSGPRRGPGSSPAGLGHPETVLALLRRVDAILDEHADLESALPPVLDALCRAGRWAAACGRTFRAEGPDEATGAETWRVPDPAVRREALQRASGSASRELNDGRTAVSGPLGSLLSPRRAGAAREAGLAGVLAFLVHAEDRVAARVELFSREAEAPSERVVQAVDLVRRRLDAHAARERGRRAVATAAAHCRRLGERLQRATLRLRHVEEAREHVRRSAHVGLFEWSPESGELEISDRARALLRADGDPEVPDGSTTFWLGRIHPADRERVEAEMRAHLEDGAAAFDSIHRVGDPGQGWTWIRVRALATGGGNGTARLVAGSVAEVDPPTGDAPPAAEPESAATVPEAAPTAGDAASTSRGPAPSASLFGDGGTGQRHPLRRPFTSGPRLHDPLTGLPTRRLFLDRAEQALRRHMRRPDRRYAVLVLQLDGLVEAAERLEPEEATDVLLSLVRRAAVVIRPGDTLARGAAEDELLLLLEEVAGLEDAVAIARRILAALDHPLTAAADLELHPRIGLVFGRPGYDTGHDLLRDATLAAGRARRRDTGLQIFDGEVGPRAREIAALEPAFRKAFEARDLFLEYQPVVSLDDGQITGLEAFVRWEHPERGVLGPEVFLPVALEAGLLDEVDYWVLERACRQMRVWDEEASGPPPTLTVNVSGSQLRDEAFAGRVLDAVTASGLDAARVRLDIPESELARNGEATCRQLERICRAGIGIALDDFGSGRSSLTHLHRFPVHALKIDRGLVSGGEGMSHGWDVARTVVELGRVLGMEVIAEGVETREQFLELRRLGCARAQGFFFAAPLPVPEVPRLLRDGYPMEAVASRGRGTTAGPTGAPDRGARG